MNFSEQLRKDVETARESRADFSHEHGKGSFSYQLNANVHGLLTFTPLFKHAKKNDQKYNALERFYQDPVLPTTVARDEKGYRIFIQSAELNGNKVDLFGERLAQYRRKHYNRNNKISERGTILRPAAVNKIKNSILHKYYSSGGDYSGEMKFFTYTIQKDFYQKKEQEFNRTKQLIERERNRGLNEYHPYSAVSVIAAWEKKNIHPDQYFIRKFSEHLENLTKRKKNKLDSYVWVAEKTENGVIHFHAIFECKYINAQIESRDWSNRCGFSDSRNSVQYGVSRKGNQINNSGSQGINPAQISSYLTKYISKNQSTIYGRNYGMSRNFQEHAYRGQQKLVNPVLFIRNEETGSAAIIAPCPWGREKQIYLPVTILKTGFIELPTGRVPIYVMRAHRKKLIEQLFPKLYARCGFLLEDEKKTPSRQLELVI